MRLRRRMNSFIQGNGSILPGEVFVVLNQNPAVFGKHPAHPLKPTRGLYQFRTHTNNQPHNPYESKAKTMTELQWPPLKPGNEKFQEKYAAIKRDGIHLQPGQVLILIHQLAEAEACLASIWKHVLQDASPLFAPVSKPHRDVSSPAPKP